MENRNEFGRFTKGNKAAKGFPKKGIAGRTPDEYRHIIKSVISFPKWREIIIKAYEQAKEGDDKARKFLADYLADSPQQFLDITTAGEKISFTPLDELSDAQRDEYFARLSTALSRSSGSVDLANTASQKE